MGPGTVMEEWSFNEIVRISVSEREQLLDRLVVELMNKVAKFNGKLVRQLGWSEFNLERI